MSKIFHYLIAGIAWLQIVASPLLIGLGLGSLVYFPNPSSENLAAGIVIASAGLIIGVFWANRVWKTKGTVWFMSRIMATPELDPPDAEEKSKSEKSADRESSL